MKRFVVLIVAAACPLAFAQTEGADTAPSAPAAPAPKAAHAKAVAPAKSEPAGDQEEAPTKEASAKKAAAAPAAQEPGATEQAAKDHAAKKPAAKEAAAEKPAAKEAVSERPGAPKTVPPKPTGDAAATNEPAAKPAAAQAGGSTRPAKATVPANAPPQKARPVKAVTESGAEREPPRPPSPPATPEEAREEAMKIEDLVKQAEAAAQGQGFDDEVYQEQPLTPQQEAELVARQFFLSLISGDARHAVDECAFPFVLEGERIHKPEDLFQDWLRRVRSKRVDLLVLYGIEVLDPKEMERKYGPPPPRIASLPWKNRNTYVAIANLSGHAAVAVLKRTVIGNFVVVGYTD